MRGTSPSFTSPWPLAEQLPAPYQGDDFTEQFLSAFDDGLAPILATLDSLDAYFDPALAPPDFLAWLASWVGIELNQNWSPAQQRRLVATAVEVLHWQGTATGLALLLQRFLGIDPDAVTVEDTGGVTWSVTPRGTPPGSHPPSVHVRVEVPEDDPLDERRLRRLVGATVPAHVAHDVEVVS